MNCQRKVKLTSLNLDVRLRYYYRALSTGTTSTGIHGGSPSRALAVRQTPTQSRPAQLFKFTVAVSASHGVHGQLEVPISSHSTKHRDSLTRSATASGTGSGDSPDSDCQCHWRSSYLQVNTLHSCSEKNFECATLLLHLSQCVCVCVPVCDRTDR